MGLISAGQAAALAKAGTARLAPLVFLDFLDNPWRLWQGAIDIVSGGETWRALGQFGRIDGIVHASGTAASPVTLTLSGSAALPLALALAEADAVEGRAVYAYWQIFDADWQPQGAPSLCFAGTMGQPTVTRQPDRDSVAQSITIVCEGPMGDARRDQSALCSPADQDARWPGLAHDTFFDYTPTLRLKTINVPPK